MNMQPLTEYTRFLIYRIVNYRTRHAAVARRLAAFRN